VGEVEHLPVLFHETLEALQPRPGGVYIDCTVGAGGHAAGILEHSHPDGRLLGIDADPAAIALAHSRLERFSRSILVQSNFAKLKEIAQAHGFDHADGILLDLGLSSFQLTDRSRGFSFLHGDAPLDMRFDPAGETTAANLVNHLSERDLADILWRYGEERRSRRIARAILAHRPIETAGELADLVAGALGQRGRIHPATRTFQALRIAVNRELQALEEVLPQAVSLLRPSGILAVISFHSLEDRIVKQFLRREATAEPPTLRLVTRKPIRPTREEIERNRRSRSAKLRVAERL